MEHLEHPAQVEHHLMALMGQVGRVEHLVLQALPVQVEIQELQGQVELHLLEPRERVVHQVNLVLQELAVVLLTVPPALPAQVERVAQTELTEPQVRVERQEMVLRGAVAHLVRQARMEQAEHQVPKEAPEVVEVRGRTERVGLLQ